MCFESNVCLRNQTSKCGQQLNHHGTRMLCSNDWTTCVDVWMYVTYTHTHTHTHTHIYIYIYIYIYTGLFEMIVGVLTTCHTQYTWDRSIWFFYLIEQHSKFLLHTLQVLYMCTLCDSTNINTIIDNHHWHATNSLERTRLSCWCL